VVHQSCAFVLPKDIFFTYVRVKKGDPCTGIKVVLFTQKDHSKRIRLGFHVIAILFVCSIVEFSVKKIDLFASNENGLMIDKVIGWDEDRLIKVALAITSSG